MRRGEQPRNDNEWSQYRDKRRIAPRTCYPRGQWRPRNSARGGAQIAVNKS